MTTSNNYMDNKKLFTKSRTIEEYRYRMVIYAIQNNISSAAREFKTDRKTVRFWLKKYQEAKPSAKSYEDELNSLKNLSRKNQYHPNKLPVEIVEKIIQFRGNSKIGARTIKVCLGLDCSYKTIHKKLKQQEKVGKPIKKYHKKRDMSEKRKKYLPMVKLQTDVKYLTDIPNLSKGILLQNFPKYQITVRDYKAGFSFIGFSYYKDSTNVGIFIAYVLYCLVSAGIDISKIHFQSDWGSEFRNKQKKNGLSFYEQILVNHNVKYVFNPVCRPTFNSDVESFHGRIEEEFYSFDDFDDLDSFMQKAWMYMIYYNGFRKNRNKDNKSPIQILKEHNCKNLNRLVTFPPIIVDYYIKDIEMIKKGGEFKWSPLIIFIKLFLSTKSFIIRFILINLINI
ncbi:MAG: hypothetical protein FWG98_11035 [Candidatus Cloacimonetes bacterium]|nr:hypothetical protein [Candidatus Cloacimonadota bacterium]